jgi:hypothetical protein
MGGAAIVAVIRGAAFLAAGVDGYLGLSAPNDAWGMLLRLHFGCFLFYCMSPTTFFSDSGFFLL